MTADELVERLRAVEGASYGDPEIAHGEADLLLLKFIDDAAVTAAYSAIEKWYG